MIKTSPDGQTVGGGIHKKMISSDTLRNYMGVDDIDESIEKFESAGGKQVHEKAGVPGEDSPILERILRAILSEFSTQS